MFDSLKKPSQSAAFLTLAALLLAAAFACPASPIAWTNTMGGNWSAAANWSPNQVPGSTNDATISAGGTYTVVMDINSTVNSLALGGASGLQTLNLGADNLTLINAGAVASNGVLDLAGGTLGGPGSLIVNGAFNWSGGVLSASSSLMVGSNGVLNILGAVSVLSPLTNFGTVNWQAGNIEVYYASGTYAGVIWNQPGAVWNLQCNQTLLGAYGVEQFHNAGLLVENAGTGVTSFGLFLSNSATVHAENGTIQFNGGSDVGGLFQADAGAAIGFNGGSYLVVNPVDFQGPGLVQFVGSSSVTLAGPLANWTMNGGKVVGLQNVSGTLNLTNTQITGGNTLSGTLNWNGSQLNPGSSLTVGSNGVLNIVGGVSLFSPLTNFGSVNWQAGNIEVYYASGTYAGVIWNQPGAVWDLQCNQTLLGAYGDEQFHNAGLLLENAGTGVTSFGLFLSNSATVHAENGTLQFNGGSDAGGLFQADASAAIEFDGGSYLVVNPVDFQGPGQVQFGGNSSVTLAGPLASWTMNGGKVVGLQNVSGTLNLTNTQITGSNTLSGTLNWNGSQLSPGSSLTVGSNGILNIVGAVSFFAPLTNFGTVNWQAGNIEVYFASGTYAGVIWNQSGAVWNIQCDQTLVAAYGDEQFHNAGMLLENGGTGVTSFGLFLSNSATVHAESGTLQFNGGSDLGGLFQADAGAAIEFNGGNYLVVNPVDFQGPGPVQFLGSSSVTLAGPLASWTMNGGKVVGLQNVSGALNLTNTQITGSNTLFGTLNWNGSQLSPSSSLTVGSNGVLNILGAVSFFSPLTNFGTVNWQAGNVELYNGGSYTGVIWNQSGAVWNIQCDQTLVAAYGGEQFNNAGLLRKNVTTGTTTLSGYLYNNGTVEADSGVVSLPSSFAPASAGNLAISLGGASSGAGFGKFQFNSAPVLTGLFTLLTRNGFTPSAGQTFLVISYPAATGDFLALNGLDLGGGLWLQPALSVSGMVLSVGNYAVGSAPRLQSSRSLSGVFIRWPATFTGWTLQTVTNLSISDWTTLPVAGLNNLTFPNTNLQQYFRLTMP